MILDINSAEDYTMSHTILYVCVYQQWDAPAADQQEKGQGVQEEEVENSIGA